MVLTFSGMNNVIQINRLIKGQRFTVPVLI